MKVFCILICICGLVLAQEEFDLGQGTLVSTSLEDYPLYTSPQNSLFQELVSSRDNSSYYELDDDGDEPCQPHPAFATLYKLIDDRHRNKRTIRLYPSGNVFLTKYGFKLPIRNVTMYKSAIDLDFYVVVRIPDYLASVRKRRSVLEETHDMKKENLKTAQRQKRAIFDQMETAMNGFSFPSRACVLRAICEVAEAPLIDGLFADYMNFFLTPSNVHEDSENPDEDRKFELHGADPEYQPYLEAEIHGKMNGNCQKKYYECDSSLFDIIPYVAHYLL